MIWGKKEFSFCGCFNNWSAPRAVLPETALSALLSVVFHYRTFLFYILTKFLRGSIACCFSSLFSPLLSP